MNTSAKSERLLASAAICWCVVFAAGFFISLPFFKYIYIALYLSAGAEVFADAFLEIKKERNFFSEEMLMTLASLAALVLSDYAESAAVMILYRIGEMISGKTASKAEKSVLSLLDMRVNKSRLVLKDGKEKTIFTSELKKGDEILIATGDAVPVDGVVVKGSGNFDTSAITGESLPLYRKEGDEVSSGWIAVDRAFIIKAEKTLDDSLVTKILKMSEEAAARKSRQEKFISRFAAIYTPAVFALSVLLTLVPVVFFKENFSIWFYRSAEFLVASCPCALVISVPLAFFLSSGRLARDKIYIKGSEYLEKMCGIDTVCFDKTGTLTDGKFVISSYSSEIDDVLFKRAVSSIESFSSHPIAQAVCREWGKYADHSAASGVEEIPGNGITGIFNGKRYFIISSKAAAEEYGLNAENADVCVLCDGKSVGNINICDSIKGSVGTLIEKLKKFNVKTVMLSGDSRKKCEDVAVRTGISEFYFSLKPDDKMKKIEEFTASGSKTAFVGDGINDILCIKRADVGFAIGGIASDSVRESADIILETGNPADIIKVRGTALKTLSVVRLNITAALFVKFAVLALAAAGLVPMWVCVFADVGALLLTVTHTVIKLL